MRGLEQECALSKNNKKLHSKMRGNKNSNDERQKFRSFGVDVYHEASDQRFKPRDATSMLSPKVIFNLFKKPK